MLWHLYRTCPDYDPRERIISAYIQERKIYNVFLDLYHRLTGAMASSGVTSKVHAVNVDAALTCILMGIAWPLPKVAGLRFGFLWFSCSNT